MEKPLFQILIFSLLGWGVAVWATPDPQLPLLSGCAQSIAPPSALAQTVAFAEKGYVNIDGKPSTRLMLVLRTNGCYYDKGNAGCTMCDFKRHAISPSHYRVQRQDLMAQYHQAYQKFHLNREPVQQIDLLTLGNFFNKEEVNPIFWGEIMRELSRLSDLKKVVIESRTPFITEENIEIVRKALRRDIILEVSIGVESSDDHVRNEVLKKGLKWSQLESAVQKIAAFREQNVQFQAYLLIKPHTLSEHEAIEDAVNSARDVTRLVNRHGLKTRLAFEPVFVTHDTPLEVAFLSGEYQPVNLWSVLEVIRKTHTHPEIAPLLGDTITSLFVGLSDEGLSDNRVTSSCPRCRDTLWQAIQKYNGTQDLSEVSALSCRCMAEGT